MIAKTPWSQHVFAVLADGEWHQVEDLILSTMRLVPPEKAFRRGEANRSRQGKRPLGPGPRRWGDDSDTISTGQRLIACQTIYNHTQAGRIERNGPLLRMTDGTTGERGDSRTG